MTPLLHGSITKCHVPFSALDTEQISNLLTREETSGLLTRKDSKRSLLKSTWFLTAWRIWRQHFSTCWSLLLTRFSWSVDASTTATKVRQVFRLSISSFKGSLMRRYNRLFRCVSIDVHNSTKATLQRKIEHKKSSEFHVIIKRIFRALTYILKKKSARETRLVGAPRGHVTCNFTNFKVLVNECRYFLNVISYRVNSLSDLACVKKINFIY